MGIPSYFRRILQKYPGCLSRAAPKIEALCFDFNCLIYRCLRAPSMPPAPLGSDPEAVDMWERELLKEVRRTVKEVWKVAGQPKKVYLAVDGVVPMAKIRQQRVRRFKSAWLRAGETGWDSNAITPGTAFMEKLTKDLEGLAKEQGRGWAVSGIGEPGEGEHKIMRWLRESKGLAGAIIYGLDADLILLSMLVGSECGLSLWLLREKQEFGGKMITDADGEQEYTFMNLDEFKGRVGVKGDIESTLNYVALMSLMGNDFLPHSLTHKLNDDGHDCALKEFRAMCQKKIWLVKDKKIQLSVLLDICKRWSADEDDRMFHMIQKKREQAERGVGKGMDESEGLPLEWNVESVFLNTQGRLLENWRDEYWRAIHPDGILRSEVLCKEYVYGCQWIVDYYTGNQVNKSWIFSSWIPPLWSDLVKWLEINKEVPSISIEDITIQPAEQLAMVLPLESWGLVRDRGLRRLPALAPQMWPMKFEFFSLGRKWLWECEARIPVLTAVRLREILSEAC